MQILNIAGYKFIALAELENLRNDLQTQCLAANLKGTILLSDEGVNINLAGSIENIASFRNYLLTDKRFADMTFHETYSETIPFQLLKIKIKKEIITLRQPVVDATLVRAPNITPEEFKQWLDEKRDITILDTRNDYEIRFGAFANALNLHMTNFGEFPTATSNLNREKPIVMYCTGGIRCEKAALYLQANGFAEVYQLEGGILNYFAKVGGAHYEGECFIFDERVSVDTHLNDTKTLQCQVCQGPVKENEQQMSSYISGVSCPSCHEQS